MRRRDRVQLRGQLGVGVVRLVALGEVVRPRRCRQRARQQGSERQQAGGSATADDAASDGDELPRHAGKSATSASIEGCGGRVTVKRAKRDRLSA